MVTTWPGPSHRHHHLSNHVEKPHHTTRSPSSYTNHRHTLQLSSRPGSHPPRLTRQSPRRLHHTTRHIESDLVHTPLGCAQPFHSDVEDDAVVSDEMYDKHKCVGISSMLRLVRSGKINCTQVLLKFLSTMTRCTQLNEYYARCTH